MSLKRNEGNSTGVFDIVIMNQDATFYLKYSIACKCIESWLEKTPPRNLLIPLFSKTHIVGLYPSLLTTAINGSCEGDLYGGQGLT